MSPQRWLLWRAKGSSLAGCRTDLRAALLARQRAGLEAADKPGGRAKGKGAILGRESQQTNEWAGAGELREEIDRLLADSFA